VFKVICANPLILKLLFPKDQVGIGNAMLRRPRSVSYRAQIESFDIRQRTQGTLVAGRFVGSDDPRLAFEAFSASINENVLRFRKRAAIFTKAYHAVDKGIYSATRFDVVQARDNDGKVLIELLTHVLDPGEVWFD